MASIERRPVEGGKFEYRARWRDAEGRSRRSRWFPRKLDADKLRATVEADLHRGTYVDMSNTVTVAEFARQWADNRPIRSGTARLYDNLTRHHIAGTPLGGRPLVKVKPSEVQAWAAGRAQVLAPSTLLVYFGVLRSMFASAVQDGLLARNPVHKGIALPKLDRREIVPLTVEQVQALAEAMPPHMAAMVLTQAGLGLRQGELLALRVSDVNFLGRAVRIEWQQDQHTLQRVPPKTPKSRREIPLPDVVAAALASHIRAFPPAPDGTVFTRVTGRSTSGLLPVDQRRYGEQFRRAVRRADLPATTTTHDLRHAYACWLLHAGESVHAVAERLGHENPTMVLKVYGHVMPNQEDRTRRAIDAAFAAAEQPAAGLRIERR